MKGVTMKTPDRVAEAQRLRDAGWLYRQIAESSGVSVSTVHAWVTDPDGLELRARKDSYRGRCVDCGALTDGSNGRGNPAKRCAECSARYQHEHAVWTRERLITEAHRWRDLTGSWPVTTYWHSTVGSSRTRAAYRSVVLEFRALTGPWPSIRAVQAVFGSWAAFMEACGGVAPGTCRGVRWGQRAIEMQAALDRANAQSSPKGTGLTSPFLSDLR